jgi:hypothetical protein
MSSPILTEVEFCNLIFSTFPHASISEDADGQVIIHTNKTINADGSVTDLYDWSL